MKHFSLEQWADFARDVARAEDAAAMSRHLESGCKECRKVFEAWKTLHEASRREAAYEPPDDIVRIVKSLGATRGLGWGPSPEPSLAELLFDSFRSPLLAGVRSTSAAARHLLYSAGKYRIDLRLQPSEGSSKGALLGQILNSSEPAQPVGVMAVTLKKQKTPLAKSQTNRFGEFHLDLDWVKGLQLETKLPDGDVFRVPLVSPLADQDESSSENTDSKRVTRNSPRDRRHNVGNKTKGIPPK